MSDKSERNIKAVIGLFFMMWIVTFSVASLDVCLNFLHLPLWLSGLFMGVVLLLFFKPKIFYPNGSRLLVFIVVSVSVGVKTYTQEWSLWQIIPYEIALSMYGYVWLVDYIKSLKTETNQ